MIRSCINVCLFAVISLFFGVIWLSPVVAQAAPTILPLGQISEGLRGPTMIDLDSDGNLYVADSRHHAVIKFNRYGSRIGVLSGAQASGAGLAVAADGRVYVSAGDKVAILNAAGALTGYLGQGAGEFLFAGSIDFDANGNIYVVDQTAGQIKVFGPDGLVGSVFPVQQFGGGIDLSIDPSSNLIYIVNDNINLATGTVPTLYIYDAGGVLQSSLPASSGFGGAVFDFGTLAFDDAAYYYVSDFNAGAIRVMDVATNAHLLTYGVGAGDSPVDHPGSMAFDASNGLLYVTYGDVRVDVYGVDGGAIPVPVNNPPSVPAPVTLGEVSSLTPDLVFNNSTDPENNPLNYNVQVFAGVDLVSSFSVAEAVSQTVATVDISLNENASYTWRVQADDGVALSGWSAAQTIYVNATQEAPSAPILNSFLVGELAGSEAVLAWSPSADADPFAGINYRVEIYEGGSLIASSMAAGASTLLAGYSDSLTPGSGYSWAVVAVDNTALETASTGQGHFVFQASVLSVTANVDGAKVYLGGHHGYAGRYLGVAPVEVRGLVEGDYSVVVEAAGFEPFVSPVTIIKDAPVGVLAELKGARIASSFGAHELTLGGLAYQGVDVAPIVADLNQDAVLDLLLADNGQLKFYAGSLLQEPQANETIESLVKAAASGPAPGRVVFSGPAQQLTLPSIPGAAPCLVDWNNDDKFDLLIGGADGSVNLFLGQGGLTFSATAQWLVTVAAQAVPAVADFDADGDKDLIVGSGNNLLLFDNVGSDSAPVLNSQTTLATATAPVVPIFVDWDADGARDLMLLSQGELSQAVVANGLVTSVVATGLNVAGSTRVFALNFAGSPYTDLLFATEAGLVVANGQQGEFASAYKSALLVKVADVEQQVLTQAPELVGRVANISSRIGRGKYDSALKKAEQLADLLGADSAAGLVVGELVGILQ